LKVAIIGGGLLMMLDSVGIPVTALMGGAAVLGLAAAFGAQKLITDFFSGFMILLEQQYTINDVIKIGDVSGTVEHISLRMTMIRDLNGAVHFIPHGEISKITNMTHTWSRALFDVTVPFAEDINAVIRAIEDVGEDICSDRKYAPDVMEGLTMLGVDALATANVTVRFFINTRPLKQWEIKREYLRRLKIAFDRLGIGSPAGAKAAAIPATTVNKPAITQKAA
jgi:small conductance mechanosensitive channel